jgi:transposase
MIKDFSTAMIYIRPGITDMRKAINGLAIEVQEEMSLDPLDGALFLFCNKKRKILKALYWDNTGFCLWQKRLEKHRFPWPDTEEKARGISFDELSMLLKGIDFWKAHDTLKYSEIA